MGTKMAVAFGIANIFMAKIEKEILRQSSIKPIFWKRPRWRHISMGHKQKRNRRIPSTGKQRPSYNQILSRLKYQKQRLHSWIRKVQRCQIQQGFYPWRANTLQAYRNIPIHLYSCHPPGVTKGFIKGEASRPLKNKFLWNRFWREQEEFFNTPQE